MVKSSLAANGLSLINDFQNTQILIRTIEGADYQAKMSEEEILNKFSAYRRSDQVLVNPNDLPLAQDDNLVKESLNAHLQKVQSEQIKDYGVQTINDLEKNANALYLNKKVRIKVVDKKLSPIHNGWINQRTGQQNFGITKALTVSGRIVEISLTNNYIIIKPLLLRKLVNSSLIDYLIEIIAPDSLQPMVSIAFI
ncbi:MAG TPA: hypothetical protein VIH90_05590 [Candidatus Saccharimonadales bacterium]